MRAEHDVGGLFTLLVDVAGRSRRIYFAAGDIMGLIFEHFKWVRFLRMDRNSGFKLA